MKDSEIFYNNKGMALVTVLIIIFVLTILTGVILTLLSNQVRLIEHDNARTESRYADEAVMVRELELLRKNLAVDTTFTIDNMPIDVNYTPGAGINQTGVLNLTHDYSVIF